jgi:hypothetical protein
MRELFRVIAAAAAITVITAGITGCSGAAAGGVKASQAKAWEAPTANPKATVNAPVPEVGLFALGGPTARANFAAETGVRPAIELNFSSWDSSFLESWASNVTAAGAVPLVQVGMGKDASQVPGIASGADDQYLISYATAVRAFGHPVILSFGHEMNGTWYSWGWKHVSPAAFVAAWKHIVTVFRDQGATNVTWLWTVQAYADAPASTTSPAPWWPGSDYVTEVGVDGHYLYAGETFAKIFDQALTDVRDITDKPILIAETAISPKLGQQAMLPDLLSGVKAQGLLGFVYFDATGNADYRLKTSAVLTAFGAAAKKYGYAGVKK